MAKKNQHKTNYQREQPTIQKYDESTFKHRFLERSSFKVLFSKYRMEYLKSVEQFIKKTCEKNKIEYSVDYDECTMEVGTNELTRDPYVILKADEFIQLLSKGMHLEDAVKVFEEEVFSEIIKARSLCGSEQTFERRRKRLLNPKILKAIETLTKCKVLVSGKYVCIVGVYKGLSQARKIIVGCFENTHPIFAIKELMIKKDLLKKDIEGEWDRFVPTVRKTHSKKRKPGRVSGGMPEEIRPSKKDLQKETGEFYADEKNIKADEELEKRRERMRDARRKREMA